MKRKHLTQAQTAEWIGRNTGTPAPHKSSISRWINKGLAIGGTVYFLEAVRVGGRVWVEESAIRRFLEAIQEVPAFGVVSGLNDLELGMRLRYEIQRELDPYVGFSWLRRFAGTADLALLEGEPQSGVVGVVGVRVWF